MEYNASSVLSLISKIHSRSAEIMREELGRSGLEHFASSHGFILYTLSRCENPISMGELANRINRDKSTTTALVKKLEEAGLVKTKKDEKDSRKHLIFLTDNGSARECSTAEISHFVLNRAWRGFSEAEKDSLVRLLVKMEKNL